MIELYTAATPNGRKISICLEELQIPYETKTIDLSKQEQKEPWFLKINPNGRIPAIIDHSNDDIAIFESGAILIYLAEKANALLGNNPKQRLEVIQWLMYQMSAVGPMQGQLHVFSNYFDEHLPSVISRYERETHRIYGILDQRLSQKQYLADVFSIADIATWPWIDSFIQANQNMQPFKHLYRWYQDCLARPSFKVGNTIPPEQGDDEDKINAGKSMLS